MVDTMIKRLSLKLYKAQFIFLNIYKSCFPEKCSKSENATKSIKVFKIFFIYESNYFNYEMLLT